VVFYNGGFRIYRVSKEALAQGGDATLGEPIAQLPVQFGSLEPYGFVVSCDGFAYVAVSLQLNQYPWGQPRIFKVDLAARAVVGDRLLGAGEELHNLALSCQTNELWSARFLNVQENTSAAIARTEVTPNGFGISEDVFMTPAAAFPIGVAVGVGGTVYFQTGTNAILAKRGAINACAVPTGALPVCETPKEAIVIVPLTDRWKGQRGDDLINIVIGSSVALDAAQPFILRYTGKKADGTVVAATTEVPLTATPMVPPPQGYAYGYTLGWRHLDPAGAKLPVGNYTLAAVAPAVANQSALPPPLESPEYEKVSLVEVKSVEFFQCSESICGKLDVNTNAGGGSAFFPDAGQPGGIYRRQVGVRATIDPPLNGEATDVAVYFRAIDVDDPSASTAPVDAETPSVTPDNPAADNYGECAGPNDPCVAPTVTGPPVNASNVSEGLFFVSPYPGVNYRVTASTSAAWLTDLRGKLSSTSGEVEHAGGTLSTDAMNNELAQVSEMLTVWRVLNVELKTMDPAGSGVTQEQLQHNGNWTEIKNGKVIHKPEGIKDADHPDKDDWVGAYLRPAVTDANAAEIEPALPDGQTVYFVDDSKKDSASVEGSLAPFLASTSTKYYLRDDELTSLTSREHDMTFLTDILKAAYIKVDMQSNPVPLVTWTKRLPPETLNNI